MKISSGMLRKVKRKVKHINLVDNLLSGSIPDKLGNCINLQTLALAITISKQRYPHHWVYGRFRGENWKSGSWGELSNWALGRLTLKEVQKSHSRLKTLTKQLQKSHLQLFSPVSSGSEIMVGESKNKVPIVRRSTRFGSDVAEQSPRRKSTRGKKNADKPTGQPVCQRKLRKGVRKVEKPNAQPVHQRNLRPRKSATVIIEDISSSEASEPQGPPQPKQVAELSRIFFCSRCGLSEATTQQTRKKKANNDDHGLSGSPKSVDPQNEQANLKAKRTKTAVSTPPLRKHSYSLRSGDSLWSGDGMDVSDEVNKGTTSTYADIDRGDVDDDANESTVNQQRPTPADLLPESFNDEKPVNVTWGESNPHLYTSWIRATVLQHQSPVRIVKFRLHPPQVKKFGGSEFRRCGEKVRVPSTAVEAVEHSSSSPDLDIGGCGGPMVDDPNTTILVPDEDENYVVNGGKRVRKISHKIRGVYTPDARLKGLFESDKKPEYKSLAMPSRGVFRKLVGILSENLAGIHGFQSTTIMNPKLDITPAVGRYLCEHKDWRPAAKFMEIHANGGGKEEMSKIVDSLVDLFHEKYAMDCYEEFIGNVTLANQ
ncbi:hypothetical protein Bca52824_027015 [Brassica carinata]|uniref:Uncharacterized protein n=1 Tax=Brassica carinata TaxID=52824 RepID=A0A8X7SJ55_BRACI|nr:hypothetical protein Bca52824_027015 [Brassica carinata]